MSVSPDTLAASAARDFAQAVANRWQGQFGNQLLGAYLLGSLAHGGFSHRYSDIDVGVVTESGLDPETLAAMRAEAAIVSADLVAKLSIFWTDRHFAIGRFPPLDRADYLERGVTLVERERIVPRRPALDEVRAYLIAVPFANWARNAREFATADALAPERRKAYLRAHLYPARFAMSFMTGGMASNDDAVAWLEQRPPPGLDMAVIARALAIRRAGDDPDELFAERGVLVHQVAACAALVADSAAERP
jgi:predicted nucleotidyltransferase